VPPAGQDYALLFNSISKIFIKFGRRIYYTENEGIKDIILQYFRENINLKNKVRQEIREKIKQAYQ